MEDNNKTFSSQLVTFTKDSYLDRTSRPIYALAYLIGFIILYELGTILISTEAMVSSLQQAPTRVVSFAWIQNILIDYLHFPARLTWITTPLVVIIILLALQITSKKPWKINFADFIPMTIESILLAVPLIALILMINRTPEPQWVLMNASEKGSMLAANLVSAIGAGIYEELVFRLILISLLMMLFQDFLAVSRTWSIIASVAISAILFSAHHHIYFTQGTFVKGEDFVLAVFIFRAMAGVYFAAIFAVRGFAIAVGTHAFYDIIAAVLIYALIAN